MIAAVLMLLLPFPHLVAGSFEAPSSVLQRVGANERQTLSGEELLKIGELHDAQRHYHETLTYYRLALSAFREAKDARGTAVALVKMARVYEQQGKFREASATVREALPILSRVKDVPEQAQALMIEGRVAARLGQFEQARVSLGHAVRLFDRARERKGKGWIEAVTQLGLLQVGDGSVEAGLALLEEARQAAHTREDPGGHLAAVVALGTAYRLLDRPIEASRLFEEGLALAQEERNTAVQATLHLRLAHLHAQADRVNEAIQSGARAASLSQTTRDTATEAAALSILGDLYRQVGQTSEAEASEQRALMIYRHRQTLVHGGW